MRELNVSPLAPISLLKINTRNRINLKANKNIRSMNKFIEKKSV